MVRSEMQTRGLARALIMCNVSTGMAVFSQEVKVLTDVDQCPLDKGFIS